MSGDGFTESCLVPGFDILILVFQLRSGRQPVQLQLE